MCKDFLVLNRVLIRGVYKKHQEIHELMIRDLIDFKGFSHFSMWLLIKDLYKISEGNIIRVKDFIDL